MCEGLFEVPYTIRILQVGPDYWQLVQLLQQPRGLEKSSDDRRKKSSFDNHEDNYKDNATVNGGNPTPLRSGKALQFPAPSVTVTMNPLSQEFLILQYCRKPRKPQAL